LLEHLRGADVRIAGGEGLWAAAAAAAAETPAPGA
jgi:hypothetical protein